MARSRTRGPSLFPQLPPPAPALFFAWRWPRFPWSRVPGAVSCLPWLSALCPHRGSALRHQDGSAPGDSPSTALTVSPRILYRWNRRRMCCLSGLFHAL